MHPWPSFPQWHHLKPGNLLWYNTNWTTDPTQIPLFLHALIFLITCMIYVITTTIMIRNCSITTRGKKKKPPWAYYSTWNKTLRRINTLNFSWQNLFNSINFYVENDIVLPIMLLLWIKKILKENFALFSIPSFRALDETTPRGKTRRKKTEISLRSLLHSLSS